MKNDINNGSVVNNEILLDKIATLEEELKLTKDNLLQQEYEGGIAEMSASVLHNIGNTLTPSKIAISQMLQRLHNSTLRKHIKSILDPIEAAISTCDIDESEKKKCQKILQVIPGSIEEEYQKNIEEIEKIRDKQEHIESIIALQMRYSHLKVDLCEVSIMRIIEDAISMQSESLGKRHIEFIKEIDKVSNINIQESKFLQVLINLIKNAYESIDINPDSNKQIHLKCYEEESDSSKTLVIKVKDSGIGFEQGKEKQFFDFGFTSKSEGSGFGLHFCAHFLDTIGGTISAHSDGRGLGAEFVITIPVQN